MNDKLWHLIKEAFPDAKQNEPMARYTTFKIGGPVKYMLPLRDADDLHAAMEIINAHGLDYFVFGGSSNMLVADEGFDGVALKMEMRVFSVADTVVEAEAGVVTAALTRATVDAGLTGFEWGIGVPGTIGGAVRGNAGAFGGEMKDVVERVRAYVDGEYQDFDRAACGFAYRESIFKKNGGIVVGVTLRLTPDEQRNALKKMMGFLEERNKTQPKGASSSGCVFKNYEFDESKPVWKHKDIPKEFLAKKRIPAGWLIERAGMKGARVGAVSVSAVHGNFILNEGGATAGDVRGLIARVKERVGAEFGIALEEEIQYIR